jgi:hypothetical protein
MKSTDEFTEELLTVHEQHVQKLKAEWNAKASLLEGVHKYMRVMEDEATLVVRHNLAPLIPNQNTPLTGSYVGNVERSGPPDR